ncbi:MAG: SDR family oxidoreductase [Leptolyngbya sp. SIOISBB]|nr:SDR family oxidoreductase [Leptolyngbya sp. SIOISBB]
MKLHSPESWRDRRGTSFRNRQQHRFFRRYGPWAVVTGASSGIGRAIAERLANAGLNVVLVARNQSHLEELAAMLKTRYGIDAKVLSLDLSQVSADRQLAVATQDLDVGLLVAAAGFGTSGPFINATLEQEWEMLSVNCRALMAATHHFSQRFAQRGSGGLILMSSIVGFQGTPFSAHYAATKAYVQSLAEALHVELKGQGVDVLAAAPGPTQSGFADRAGMQMGATLKPNDIAQPILNALGQRSLIFPGFLSKLLIYSLSPLPTWARARIMGIVMGGMTKHRLQSS